MFRHCALATFGLLLSASALMAQTPSPAPTPPPAPAAAEPSDQEKMEDPQVGDHWTYDFRDDITGDVKSTLTQTVTDVSGLEIGVRNNKLGTSNAGYQAFDRSWNLVNSGAWRYRPNDGTGIRTALAVGWRYRPNDGTGIRTALAVGKTWSFKSNDLNSSAGLSGKRSGTSKVTAQESVTTPAGTFDTFKVETSFQMQNVNDPTKKVQAVLETWYAPAIDHWVKRSFVSRSDGRVRTKNTIELVEYGRR